MIIVALIPALLVVISTAIVNLKAEAWWIRMFDFPRVQLVLIGLFAIVPAWLIRPEHPILANILLISLLLSLLFQMLRILPFTPLVRPEVVQLKNSDDSRSFSILISNVLMSNREPHRLLELVSKLNPDMVLTLETDNWWQEKLSVLHDRYPHRVAEPRDNLYGMHLYSQLPLNNPKIEFLIQEDVPSIHCTFTLRNNQEVILKCLHPRPPSPNENDRSTERDAELVVAARQVKDADLPAVAAGDFNDVAWSHTTRLFRRLSGLLDPRVGRGFYNTFHAGYFFFRWPLDHIFHSRQFGLVKLLRLPAIGSDHFPIYAKIALSEKAKKEQESPVEEPGDVIEGEEKVIKAGL